MSGKKQSISRLAIPESVNDFLRGRYEYFKVLFWYPPLHSTGCHETHVPTSKRNVKTSPAALSL